MSIKKRGDTIIEVMMAVAVFAVLAVITINLMNSGLNSAQRTLEELMARNEIDNQAEALRYIHESYIAERQLDQNTSQFRKLWDALRNVAQKPANLEDEETGELAVFDINRINSCSEAYRSRPRGMVFAYNAFVLNTRLILPDSGTGITYDGNSYDDVIKDIVVGINDLYETESGAEDRRLTEAPLYPRIVYSASGLSRDIQTGLASPVGDDNTTGSLAENKIYNRIKRAEGIFIIAVGDINSNSQKEIARSNYFDFYIRTCWHSIGSTAPSTITTIVRLYNPEVIE